MLTQRGEKIKLCLVIGLALVAAVVAYFRFIHKANGTAAKIAQSPPPQAKLDPAPVKTTRLQRSRAFRQPLTEPLDMDIRDIFTPLQLPKKPEPPIQSRPFTQSKPVEKVPVVAPPALAPPLNVELKGTLVGGNAPLAIINDKFVRLGEKVGDYQVVGITPTAVYLKAGKHQKVLHVKSGASQ